ncbi:hypothetical protein VNO77_31525 [Canavalia gladiata]|uniref:Uncharacterized protein n=1 Tax=Canavalia gladiata TaxID=3824 RepID=A0AAN9Q4M4_CANGL
MKYNCRCIFTLVSRSSTIVFNHCMSNITSIFLPITLVTYHLAMKSLLCLKDSSPNNIRKIKNFLNRPNMA